MQSWLSYISTRPYIKDGGSWTLSFPELGLNPRPINLDALSAGRRYLIQVIQVRVQGNFDKL